jgi:hypothetical protein
MTFIVDGTSGLTFPNSTTQASAGQVLQVVQTVKTDIMSAAPSSVWNDVPGQGGTGTFSATITPKFSTSKVLIIVDMKGAGSQDASTIRSRLLRNSTPIYVGDAASNRPQSMGQFYISSGGGGQFYLAQLGGTFLDSPGTTSAITYKMQYGCDNTSTIVFINKTQGDRDTTYFDSRIPASITLMEIAG